MRQQLFLQLLKAYLVPAPGRKACPEQAVDLLNGRLADLDVVQVLQLVPASWSIGMVGQFLQRSIGRALHRQRTTQIQHGLARQENLRLRSNPRSLLVWLVTFAPHEFVFFGISADLSIPRDRFHTILGAERLDLICKSIPMYEGDRCAACNYEIRESDLSFSADSTGSIVNCPRCPRKKGS